jgi:multisubunit Na+/H+ antiporter MnhB subunit
MYELEILIEDIKNPKHFALGALICFICMILGYMRGSIGGLIVGIVMGILLSFSGLILLHKHREKQEEMRESLIIPKIGLTEKKEQWLRKKKLRELQAENRIDMIIKVVWWIIFAFIALNILYWISPIIYYTIQTSKI